MNISGTTQVLGIIGHPIEHVLSPVMHNELFQLQGLDWVYVPFNVQPAHLQQVIDGFRFSNIRGFNVTIPHKVSIIPLLDELVAYANQIGAVNTVKNDYGKLIGRNTDGEGAIQSLIEHDFPLNNSVITIFGAGGAARALAYHILDYSNDICVVNRSKSHLSQFLSDIRKNIAASKTDQYNISGILFESKKEIKNRLAHTDLIINTTPLGMTPHIDSCPILSKWIQPKTAVFDVIYTPCETKLLRDAQNKGCRVLNGLEMLVNQGAIAFEWWTNQKADKKRMKEIVLKWLKNKKFR
ncbi:MAG: shikimate dehydrogenase [Promethearchaeia archaeon]|nr:MAG: shikimate dehydrogenase [Candidatus Lokiarchaeia archaeon]